MKGWLLDTNVISELVRPKPSRKVTAFVAAQPLEAIFVSVVVIAEIRFGIAQVADPSRRARLEEWLAAGVRPMFEGRILPVSEEVMLKWQLLVDQGRKRHHTYSQPDLILAATALEYDLTVVTRDTKDYRLAGVPVFNPWSDAPGR